MTTNSTQATNRISTFVYLVVLAVYVLALVAIGLAISLYGSTEQPLVWIWMLVLGLISISLATYVLFQSRRHATSVKIIPPQVMTTIECRKCNIKSVREFQRGDFVYKELEKCPKCEDNQIITAIYKEVKEKEKTYPF
jgi:Na+/melibiose symporter-like transporter